MEKVTKVLLIFSCIHLFLRKVFKNKMWLNWELIAHDIMEAETKCIQTALASANKKGTEISLTIFNIW